MRRILLMLCVVAGCAMAAATGVQEGGNGYFRIVGRGDGSDAGALYRSTRRTAEEYCESTQGGPFHEVARNQRQPTIDLSSSDSVEICFRCDGPNGVPATGDREAGNRAMQQLYAACGIPYRWSLMGG